VIGQRTLLAVALVCGAIAGSIYYAGVQRVSVVVAAHLLDADRPIAADDLTTAALPPDAVPAGRRALDGRRDRQGASGAALARPDPCRAGDRGCRRRLP